MDDNVNLYKTLDFSRQEIRTITLVPGKAPEPVKCELDTVSLLDNPGFEALSYTWGEPRPTRKIFINGQRRRVGENLEFALSHLRYDDRPRTLWADAICINQEDISERNSQVQLMGTIYSRASGVLAWLGPEYNDSDLAFDFLKTMPTDPEVHWDPDRYPELRDAYTLHHIKAVNNLLERAWWHRVWTVQESILCPVLTFVCGLRQLPAEQAFKVAACWFEHLYTCCQDTWYRHFGLSAGLGDACTALGTLEGMRTSMKRPSFGQILSKFMSRRSTDPHDKIYGFLGIATEEEAAHIIPDYNKLVAQVYKEAALSLIQHQCNLDILSMRYPKSLDDVDCAIKGLPSWVPDWTLDSDSTLLYDMDDRLCALPYYNASQNTRCQVTSAASGSLAVRGKFISRVATLSSDDDHMEKSSLKKSFQAWQKIIGIDEDPNRQYARSTSTTVKDVFWQTLCCSLIPDLAGPRKNKLLYKTTDDSPYRHLFDAWWEWCEKYDCDPDKLVDIHSEYSRREIDMFGGVVSTSINMRRLFVSDGDGLIGLVPSDAAIGDSVVLLEGGRVPYIIRLVRDLGDDSNIQDSYELIGAAYVHGVMDGSEWKDAEIKELCLL